MVVIIMVIMVIMNNVWKYLHQQLLYTLNYNVSTSLPSSYLHISSQSIAPHHCLIPDLSLDCCDDMPVVLLAHG